MNVVELNVKDYIKKQSNNLAFKGYNKVFYISSLQSNKHNYLSFDEIYKLYRGFKILGKNLFVAQDKSIYKIEFHNDNILFNWPLIINKNITELEDSYLTNFLTTKYSFDNEDIGLNKLEKTEIMNLAELIYLCSDSIKDFCKALDYSIQEIEKAEKKFKRIISIYQDGIEQVFSMDDLCKLPDIIYNIEKKNPNLSSITEQLIFNDELEVIEPYINYNSILSVFFHFFKLEIVYYSFMIESERKKPKLCNICGKYTIGKCKCMKVSDSFRRNQNKKCQRLRTKIEMYLNTYSDVIPIEYKMKAERMIEQAKEDKIKHWQDLPELRRLCYGIEAKLKETK